MKINKKYFSIDYLIGFLLLLTGGSVPYVFNRNLITISLFLFLISTLFIYSDKIKRKTFNLMIISSLSVVFFLVINFFLASEGQSFIKFGFLFLCFLIALFTLIYFEVKQVSILSVLRFCFQVIMIHSLLNFFAYPFLKNNLVEIVNPFNEYTCSTFNYIFYYMPDRYQIIELGSLFCRNQGLFWEPGVLQIFLNFLFFIDAFVLKRISKVNIALIICAIILTYSTTGIVILAFQLIVFFWKQIKKNILIAPILIALFIPFYQILQDNVESKMSGENDVSAQVRMFDLVQQMLIVIDNPLTGIGLDDQVYKIKRSHYSINVEEIDYESLEKGSTNSLVFLMAAGGIPFSIYVIYALCSQRIIHNQKWLFIFIFILSVMSEPVLLKPFFLLFIMSGCMELFKKISW